MDKRERSSRKGGVVLSRGVVIEVNLTRERVQRHTRSDAVVLLPRFANKALLKHLLARMDRAKYLYFTCMHIPAAAAD